MPYTSTRTQDGTLVTSVQALTNAMHYFSPIEGYVVEQKVIRGVLIRRLVRKHRVNLLESSCTTEEGTIIPPVDNRVDILVPLPTEKEQRRKSLPAIHRFGWLSNWYNGTHSSKEVVCQNPSRLEEERQVSRP